MNVEENRLRTFGEWPANAAVDAARIARAGFYYTGHGQEVQCFLCGTRIADWNYGDQAMARHRSAEPSCPFVLDSTGTCNVPLVQQAPANSTVGLTSAVLSSSEQPSIAENRLSVEDVIEELSVVHSTDLLRDYGTAAQRLRSFKSWPVPAVVSPERLAKAGFYYLQYKDLVECAYCRGVLMRWEAGDDPDNEHRLHFPYCDFYMRQDSEDDVLELANVTLMPGTSTDLVELGIQAHKVPVSPKNTTYEERLRTFVGWSKDHKQTPEMLATAGFYYTGNNDQVRCFHCDGGLRNWEPTDDVWFEHARWFPKCTFINLVRGQEYVKYCIDNRPPLDPKIFEGVPDNDNDVIETPLLSLSTTQQPETPTVTDTEIMRLLDTAPALSALEIGLSVDRVNRTLKRRLERYGTPYTDAEELIEDVLHNQITEEYASSTPDSSPPRSTVNSTEQIENNFNESSNLSNDTEASVYLEVKKDDENKVCEYKEDVDVLNKEGKFENKRMKNKSDDITLQEENRRLKEARLCKICMDEEVGIVLLPCGHLVTCVFCAPPLTCCPLCRVRIRASVRTFLS